MSVSAVPVLLWQLFTTEIALERQMYVAASNVDPDGAHFSFLATSCFLCLRHCPSHSFQIFSCFTFQNLALI